MANIKSAKKRIKVIARKSEENKALKSALKTQLKKFDVAVASNDENLTTVLNDTVKSVDQAVAHGIIHKNKAARTKAQLAKKLG